MPKSQDQGIVFKKYPVYLKAGTVKNNIAETGFWASPNIA